MFSNIPDWLLGSLFTGIVSGLIAYGGISAEIGWLRRDNHRQDDDIRDLAKRIDAVLQRATHHAE